jgi:hypothetical protein
MGQSDLNQPDRFEDRVPLDGHRAGSVKTGIDLPQDHLMLTGIR